MGPDDQTRRPRRRPTVIDVAALAAWPARRWVAALAAATLYAVAAALATGIIANPFVSRMIPPTWWSYPVLAATAALGGLVTASYLRSPGQPAAQRRAAGGGLLTVLAIGCPTCNKLVVMAVGTSGALNLWAPLQPLIGLASIALLGWALRARLAGETSCPVPARAPSR